MSTSTVTLVTHTNVTPDCTDTFVDWQQQMNDVLTTFPGYLDQTVIPPSPPLQTDWVIIQRFLTVEAARAWLQSQERQHLLDVIQPLLVGQSDVHLFTQDSPGGSTAPVSAVISTRVKPGQQEVFLRWYRKISAIQARFEGFQGYKLEAPIPGVQDSWVTILRFDSEAHLEAWLNSEQRQQILQEAAAFSLDTHIRKVRVGFESWFKFSGVQQQSPPPIWKVNMIVLLALYPIVFLFSTFVQTPLLIHRGMPFWLAMFLSNTFSTILLGWVVVPALSKAFGWWLSPIQSATPAKISQQWITCAGVVLILCLYAVLLLAFSHIH
ncbi:antibiotic biosynthesis monooxygenase [Ktedonospora formicarum]|uniref:Antibiotic biosynthesis monooxygenase n=1 Tax=Ktedonospora formicarum TaxID=2778364 RepID=A0A8J3MRJ0_9CHLR|nr:antibiotic biosynthesis monooxygenase [Ktedonospora formicarum]GHO46107.1 antibiotic biosynthesis monooxygenase [Ktedonospora formicarum]